MSQKTVLPSWPFSQVLTHLHLPLIWAKLNCGVRIEDLHQKRFEEALSFGTVKGQCFVKEHFIHEETLCKASGLASEPDSVESYLETARRWLQDNNSLCAVDEVSDRMVGVLIARVIYRLHHSISQARMQQKGEAFHKVMDLLSHMVRSGNIFDEFDTDSFFQFHVLCVKPEFRNKGIGMGLLLCGVRQAITLKQTVVAGVFTSKLSQSLGRKLGMQVVYEIGYADWSGDDNEIVFASPGQENYSSMLMAMEVPEIFSPTKMYSLGQGL